MITPVILSGGSGKRLWPLSRQSYPKQFAPIIGEQTLFQKSALRLTGELFDKPVVITASDFRFIVTDQLHEIGIDPGAILIEPQAQNTAPAVLAAAIFLAQKKPDSIMLVSPSDHVIADTVAFQLAIKEGLSAVNSGRLVTFGIKPTRAETGYGYLELGEEQEGPIPVKRFIEKPDQTRASEMFGLGSFLWNAGIFLFRAKDIIEAFEVHAPTLTSTVNAAVKAIDIDLGFCRLGTHEWANAENISIDHAVMEKAKNLSVVPLVGHWCDLGGWDAVWRESAKDINGVHESDMATAIDCRNTLLRSESKKLEIMGIGLENIIAIAMPDAVLIADMSRAQDVKQAVAILEKKGSAQATTFPKDHRPWGWFESLVMGDSFQVKRIHVNSGASLSLQSHQHRAEHWVVVAGTAQVTIDDKIQLVTENQSVFIPIGTLHRVANFGKSTLIIIEVQTGFYLGEDDIVRYDDIYSRGQGSKGDYQKFNI